MYISAKERARLNKLLVEEDKDLLKIWKHFVKNKLNEGIFEPVKSMLEQDHVLSSSDGEVTYFGLYNFDDTWTDEDLDEYIDNRRVVINSDYDCTGLLFTSHIHWHRNPCGLVSIVHTLNLDI